MSNTNTVASNAHKAAADEHRACAEHHSKAASCHDNGKLEDAKDNARETDKLAKAILGRWY